MIQATPPWPFAGEMAALGAALIWSCSMSIFSVFGRTFPSQTLNLYKNLVAASCLILAALIIRPPTPAHAFTFVMLGLSGIIGLSLGDTALFAALKRLGAQMTSASQCLAPPMAALIAALFLGETLSPQELLGLFITAGAVGALVFFGGRHRISIETASPKTLLSGFLFALLAATCQAAGIVIQRQALQDTDVIYGTLMRVAPAILVLVTISYAARAPVSMRGIFANRRQAIFITCAAFAGTFLGLVLLSVGAKYTKAGIAAALTSTYPIWIIPIARFVLKEKISWQSAFFTCVAVGGIILMVI